ncbi:MAG TPA: hypothetical protein VFN37_12825 [Candidatus Baltobacteraceae bacterium]|nr:hypothetical protein [Candidatus Baltobacteraceae bacterium]
MLQRAGVLAIAGSQETCSGKRLKLIVTDYGERVAAQRGWSLQFGALVIPVGRLVPLGDTEVLDLHGNVSTLLMSFRFEGNSNVQYLQSLGNSSIWTIKALPNMHLTLADVDKTISAEIPIVHDGREGWIPLSGWSAETSLCG